MLRRFLRTPSSFPNDPRGFAFNQVTDRDTHGLKLRRRRTP